MSSQQQPQHYAFVAPLEPLELPVDASEAQQDNGPIQKAPSPSSSSHQEYLVALYQSYAERFPNPNLIQEYQDRDQLLHATSAAHSARSSVSQQQQQQQQAKKKKGLFGFLFGGNDTPTGPVATDNRRAAASTGEEEDGLVYVEQEDPELEHDVTLCGTNHSLDRSCIPQDAHSMARLSLASQRTRQERPHVVRASPHLPQSAMGCSTFCIVGLGMIAEWCSSSAEEAGDAEATADIPSQMESNWTVTSDRNDLLRFADRRVFDLSLVRATSFGPNFLLVSWGFNDGVVVFYRRIALPDSPIAWEAVVFLGPSSAILEHSMDVFAEDDDEDDNNAGGSDLLRVTDMVPLVVTTLGMPAAALAVSRLGGYMEVMPLPPDLWFGPVLDPSRHKPRPTKRKRGGNNHYAKRHLVNIASERAPIPILALTTMDWHLDILCLEAIRTRVTMDTEWDRERYGNAPPPAEYILVASGTQKGHEMLTFWAVTFMFADEPPTDGSAGFELHAVLQEALDVGRMGADLSIFANLEIKNHWRHPRKVSLKERPKPPPPPPVDEDGNPILLEAEGDGDGNADTLGDDNDNAQPSVYDRVTSITTSAPIVAMQAIVVPLTAEDGNTSVVAMLSLLDWNGSVTIMDCSGLERMISHRLSDEEYRHMHDADMAAAGHEEGSEPPPVVLVKTLVDRSRMILWMNHGSTATGLQSCVSAQWLARADNPMDPWLVLLTSLSGKKKNSRITILSGLLELNDANQDAAIQDIPFPTMQASLQGNVSTMVDHDSLLRIVFPPKREAGKLCVCLLQPLQPRDIILSLARDRKYQKAVEAAQQLSSEEQQHASLILEECRQELWEQTFDLQWLKLVTDDAYIIQQAFLLFESNNASGNDEREEHKFERGGEEASNENPLLENMDLDKCRDIYVLALQRTSKIRLASALALGKDGEEVKDKLEAILVHLGTFQLLCRVLDAEASFLKFRTLFMQASIVDLAKSFAPVGDITALSILWFRHEKELQSHKLEILSQLPMTLKTRNYCYLLPVLSKVQQEDSFRTDFFIADVPPSEGDVLRHISQLPSFLREEMDIRVVLNISDEKMVLGRNGKPSGRGDVLPLEIHDEELAIFYVSRATDMQLFVGDLQDVGDFCAVGLVALGNPSESLDAKSTKGLSAEKDSASHSLFCTRGCALALKRMLEESIGDSPAEVGEDGMIDLSPFASVTPIDLKSMDLVDVVKMVLGGQDDTETIFEIHRQHLVPLLKFLPNDQTNHLNQAIHDFCIDLVRTNDVGEEKDGSKGDLSLDNRDKNLLTALRTCAAVALGSRTSIRKSDRIISDKLTLISLVLTSTHEVSKRCQNVQIQQQVCLCMAKLIWDMYESMPAFASEEECNPEEYSEMTKADYLYQDLVGLEILAQWPGSHEHALPFIAKRNQSRDEESDEDAKQGLLVVGQEALTSLCRSFCSQTKSQKGAIGLSSLLRDLVSDIKQFFEVCYDQDALFLAVLVSTLSSELIAPLSRQAEFDLVAQFFTGADDSWWDHEQEGRTIGSYVDAIVFSGGASNASSTGDHSLQAAIACQDALGPVFPDLQDGFQLSRRYLDAAHFINTAVFTELNMPKKIEPNDLRGDLPLDVVESILRALPTAIIIGCKEWGEEPLAIQANNALRTVEEGSAGSPEQPSPMNLPPIPGGAVFHLAGILGLDDTASVLVVKSRVVHYGVASGLFGASAAVCRTILHDQNAFSSDADSVARMAAIAEVVAQEKYEDLATKRELCVAATEKFQALTSIHDCKPLGAILDTFSAFEARTSLAQHREIPQILNIPPPSDAIASLYKDTWEQYSVNVYDLFSTLQQHAAGAAVDDSLLNALCRYVFFSCIFRSTRPRYEPAGKLEKAATNELLVVGAALLLHIQDKAAFSIPATKELRQILEKQTMAVINQHPTAFEDPFMKPNEDIVRQLIGRGFTQIAARRSALATKNIGVQQALQWGVANARDPRMNEPIIFVTSQERVFVEKPSIQQVMNTFNFTQQFLSGSKTVEEWRLEHPSASSGGSPQLGRPFSSMAEIARAAPSPAPKALSQPTTAVRASAPAPKVPFEQKTAAPPAPVAKTTDRLPKAPEQPAAAHKQTPKAIGKLPTNTRTPPEITAAFIGKVNAPLTSKPAAPAPLPRAPDASEIQPVPKSKHTPLPSSKPNPPPPMAQLPPVQVQPQLPTTKPPSLTLPSSSDISSAPRAQPQKLSAPKPPQTVKAPTVKTARAQSAAVPSKNLTVNTTPAPTHSYGTPANRPLSTASSAGSDRSALKQRGEAALDAIRSTPSSHEKNMEDRRRLIEAGRRLLAKSRADNPVPVSPPPMAPKSPPKAVYTPYQPIGTTPTAKASGAVAPTQGLTVPKGSPLSAAGTARTTALPPPGKQSCFFGAGSTAAKQIQPAKASSPVAKVTKLAVDDDDGWGFDDGSGKVSATRPAPELKHQAPPASLPSTGFAAQTSSRPVTQTSSRPVTGWQQAAAAKPMVSAPPPPPVPTTQPALPAGSTPVANPEASASQGGWDFDADDLGDAGDGSTGNDEGWDFEESQNALPTESMQPVVSNVGATELSADNDEIDDGWGDDFDDF